MRELTGLAYSPWTEKARWVLDYHRLPYRYREHLMIFDEPFLRWRLRRLCGGITVPALIDRVDGTTYRLADSWEIAQHADQLGTSAKLFPKRNLEAIQRYNALSEMALSSGRALLTGRMKDDREALREALPPFIPALLQRHLLWMARLGLWYIVNGFGTRAKGPIEHEADLREVLLTLRRDLKKSNDDYLLGEFSYADIAMSVTLQFVEPVSDKFKRIGPATRRAWTDPKIAKDFQDLIAWRDRVYAKHRHFLR